jgi:hypothetical protein
MRVSTDARMATRQHRESMDATEFLTRLRQLPMGERVAIADRIPECGHAVGELHQALADLERELVAAYDRERAPLEAALTDAEGRAAA